ncbi:Mariner Mos1 transposase [Eumeta japonica]|uniref:Mariner Mos1 transposase n=1 Tax=Eumeta variegata TaxID=151549 RepID=A0A4C1ZM90_EUMVA|nr:Mariner Mos1 transposase [Eumeta japonica]
MLSFMSEQRFTSFQDTRKWVDSWIVSEDEEFFRRGIRMLPQVLVYELRQLNVILIAYDGAYRNVDGPMNSGRLIARPFEEML